MAETLFSSIPLSLIAFFAIRSISSTCDLAANSGTTPPNSLWISNWLEIIFDRIFGVPFWLSWINETAVSSQLVSIPNIIGFSDLKFFF